MGLSLLECLIAMAMGLFLMQVLVSTWLLQQENHRFLHGFAQMIDSGRSAANCLREDITMAGYRFCHLPSGSHRGIKPLAIYRRVRNDGIEIQRMATRASVVIKETHQGNWICLAGNVNYKINQVLMIADCDHSELFHLAALQHHQQRTSCLLPTSPLKYNFQKGAQVAPWLVHRYRVMPTGRLNSAKQPISALYQYTSAEGWQAWTEGVERMLIDYGTSNHNHTQWYHLPQAIPWPQINLIRITLVVVSNEPVLPQPQSWVLLGQTQSSTDRRLRRAWEIIMPLKEWSRPL